MIENETKAVRSFMGKYKSISEVLNADENKIFLVSVFKKFVLKFKR